MKPNELRIGNIIKHKYSLQPFIVKKIQLTGVSTGLVNAIYKDLLPINLTEQWLKDFGFNKIEYDGEYVWESSILGVDLNVTDAGLIFDNWKSNPINYVHQLQNLYFALTGKEL